MGKLIGSKKPKLEIKPDPRLEHKCSKCPELNFEGGKEEFYAHVLECGGDVDWDVSKKKKKKKKLVNPESVRIRNETPEEAAQKRKERFEKFNKPPPLAALKGGRMTRRQEQIIKDEKKQQQPPAK